MLRMSREGKSAVHEHDYRMHFCKNNCVESVFAQTVFSPITPVLVQRRSIAVGPFSLPRLRQGHVQTEVMRTLCFRLLPSSIRIVFVVFTITAQVISISIHIIVCIMELLVPGTQIL